MGQGDAGSANLTFSIPEISDITVIPRGLESETGREGPMSSSTTGLTVLALKMAL